MKKVFLFVFIGLMLLAIPATVFLVGKNQEVRKRAAPASALSMIPTTITKKVGDTFTLEVKLDAATNQVGIVQLRIVYDPAKLQAQDITNGPLAPSIRVSGKIDPIGKASITVGAQSAAQPITGSGTIAVLTMKVLESSATPVSIRFAPAPETFANAIGEGENNVLIGTTGANVTLLNADGSQPTPGSTPANNNQEQLGASPTATPSATPALSPTLEATDSAQATPSAVTIDSIQENEQVYTDKPTFSGKAPPGSTVTLTIYSEPQTVVVTVDENGNWTYTPTEGLESGPHTVVALASDPTTGETQTTTVPFIVDASGSGMPVSGDVNITILLIVAGLALFLTGALVPVFIQ